VLDELRWVKEKLELTRVFGKRDWRKNERWGCHAGQIARKGGNPAVSQYTKASVKLGSVFSTGNHRIMRRK
jgi:hypothetical protein